MTVKGSSPKYRGTGSVLTFAKRIQIEMRTTWQRALAAAKAVVPGAGGGAGGPPAAVNYILNGDFSDGGTHWKETTSKPSWKSPVVDNLELLPLFWIPPGDEMSGSVNMLNRVTAPLVVGNYLLEFDILPGAHVIADGEVTLATPGGTDLIKADSAPMGIRLSSATVSGYEDVVKAAGAMDTAGHISLPFPIYKEAHNWEFNIYIATAGDFIGRLDNFSLTLVDTNVVVPDPLPAPWV